MNFSLRLKELREKKHLSQKQLAIDLGVGVGTVGMWESAERIPPAKRLQTVANYFGVSVDFLLGNELGNEDFTDAERAAGMSHTRTEDITVLEEEMLHAFRAVGKKQGERGQRALIDVANGMAGIQ